MRAVILRILPVLALLALAAPVLRAQQQTGSVVFDVRDADDKPIKGAAITMGSDKLQGTQVRETDGFGRARFALLPPGVYVADVLADGYTDIRREVNVALGASPVVSIVLGKGELIETKTVTASKVVDTHETKTAYTWSSKTLEKQQIGSAGRSYLAAAGRAAGVVGGGGDPQVHGATVGENAYLIDGVNTTDPLVGTFGVLSNFDTVDQEEFITGGFQAEYGNATGGILNQVTKSGGDTVKGTLDTRWYDQRFIENTDHFNPGGVDPPQLFRTLAGTIGGPIIKQKLWYFIGAENDLTKIHPAGAFATRKFDGGNYLAKLTWQVTDKHRVTFQFTDDPAAITAGNAGSKVRADASDYQTQGAKFYTATYFGSLSTHWSLSAQVGAYRGQLDAYPANDNGLPSITEYRSGDLFQNYNDAQYSKRDNTQFKWTADRFWTGAHGDHDVKFGMDLQDRKVNFERKQPGGAAWTTLGRRASMGNPADPFYLAPDADGDGFPDNVIEVDVLHAAGARDNQGRVTSEFAQDTWHVNKHLTLDYGLRYDRSTGIRDDKKTIMDLGLLQPRFGAAFDIHGDGVQSIQISLSRSMHPGILSVPQAVNSRGDATEVFYNEAIYGIDCDGDGNMQGIKSCFTFGGPSGSTVDKHLKPTYIDQAIIGYKRSIRDDQTFGARFVMNDTKDIIEDTEFPVGSGGYLITNIPGLKRNYRGLELEYAFNRGRYHVGANWTIAAAKGNIGYTQNIGSDYDLLPEHSVNRFGYLASDRRLRMKAFGWVDLPKGFEVAYDFFLGTGAPYNRVQNLSGPDALGRAQYGVEYLDPRGSHRLPSQMTLDTEFRKHFTFGKDNVVTLIGSVTNILGFNHVAGRNEIDILDDPTTPENEHLTSTWGKPNAWQDPRSYELGLRFTF